MLDFSLEDNLVLQRYFEPQFTGKGGFLKRRNIREYADHLIEQYDVRSGQGPVTAARSMFSLRPKMTALDGEELPFPDDPRYRVKPADAKVNKLLMAYFYGKGMTADSLCSGLCLRWASAKGADFSGAEQCVQRGGSARESVFWVWDTGWETKAGKPARRSRFLPGGMRVRAASGLRSGGLVRVQGAGLAVTAPTRLGCENAVWPRGPRGTRPHCPIPANSSHSCCDMRREKVGSGPQELFAGADAVAAGEGFFPPVFHQTSGFLPLFLPARGVAVRDVRCGGERLTDLAAMGTFVSVRNTLPSKGSSPWPGRSTVAKL